MRKLLVALMILITSLSLISCSTYQLPVSETPRVLNVGGQAKITVAPDIAYLTVGVTTEDVDATLAEQKNTSIMNNIIELVKKAGVKKEDIKTVGFYISPKYDYIVYSPDKKEETRSTQEIVGYIVNNTIQITIRDIDKAGAILKLTIDNGANMAGGISFGLVDYEKNYQVALQKAVAVAHGRAQSIAKELGIKLQSRPLTISESGSYYPVYRGWESKDAMNGGAPITIEGGTLEVTANVTIAFTY